MFLNDKIIGTTWFSFEYDFTDLASLLVLFIQKAIPSSLTAGLFLSRFFSSKSMLLS